MNGPLTCITLHQPWASLIVAGLKGYETRSWPTRHRGRLGIHAGRTVDRAALDAYADIFRTHADLLPAPDALPTGCIVGTAELVACLACSAALERRLTVLERRVGNFAAGRYAWQLRDRETLAQPIPARGYQGLWKWNPAPESGDRQAGLWGHA